MSENSIIIKSDDIISIIDEYSKIHRDLVIENQNLTNNIKENNDKITYYQAALETIKFLVSKGIETKTSNIIVNEGENIETNNENTEE